MKRKLVKQGSSTLMVSLPKSWTKSRNLEKGSSVFIERKGTMLLLTADKKDNKTKTSIKLTNLTESAIRTSITNTYRTGFDVIDVNFDNERQFAILRKIIKTQLIGFEIIKKGKNICTVENITEPTHDNFENILTKIFLNIESLFEVTKCKLMNEEANENYNEIQERIKKYQNFCLRVIYKKSFEKSQLLWSFIMHLIHGQRELHHLNKFLDKNDMKFNNMEIYDRLFSIYENLKLGYFKKDSSKLDKMHNQEKEIIYEDVYKGMFSKGEYNIVLFHIGNAVKNFYLASSPVYGLIAN